MVGYGRGSSRFHSIEVKGEDNNLGVFYAKLAYSGISIPEEQEDISLPLLRDLSSLLSLAEETGVQATAYLSSGIANSPYLATLIMEELCTRPKE